MNRSRRWALTAGLILVGARSATATQINTFGKLEIAADDRSFSARLQGRVQMDGDFYSSGSDAHALPSGTFIRRARIGVSGNFHEYNYEVEFDNATDKANLRDAKVGRLLGPGTITVGQFKVFESIEEMTSSNELMFLERPYVSEATPGFKIGAVYNGTAGMLGYSGNVYNMRAAADGEDRPIDAGVGAVARAYVAPINERTVAVHFGGSYAHESTDTNGQRVRVSPIGRAQEYKDGSEFRFDLFDRRDERAQINRANVEGAVINGPLSIQAEYMAGRAKTKALPADYFITWYGQAGYVLTGESREYGFRKGHINRPKPSRASGAVELVARYQRAERTEVTNAVLTDTEFGVVYYANQNVKLMLEYGWAYNKLLDDKPHLLATRVQFDF